VRLRAIEDWRTERSDIGGGLIAKVDLGAELALGDRDWLERHHGLPAAAFDAVALPPAAPGRRLIWIAELGPHMNLLGALMFGERLKTGAGELAKNLKRLGIETVLRDAEGSPGQLDLTRQLGLKAIADREMGRSLVIDRTGAGASSNGSTVWLHFGMARAQGSGRPLAAIRREDPRVILDLIGLARAARRRETIATLLAFIFCLPTVWFALSGRVGLEIAALSPVLGLGAVIVSAQFLLLFQPTASEVDEE
jgi:Cu+-exporting ATPase